MVYTPSPIAKLKTHPLLWRFFPLKGHATFLWNFLTPWDVLSVKAFTTFWGYNSLTFLGGRGGVQSLDLPLSSSCTESLYRKMNNIFVMYSCCSIFTKQLIFSSSNFVINESNNPDKKYRKMTLLFIFWCQLLVFLIQLALVYSLYHWFPSLHSRQFLCSIFHLSFPK